MGNATERFEQLKELTARTAEEIAKADALFLSIGDGAIATDETGKVTRINKVALSILGLKEKDVIGQQFTNVIIATDNTGKPIPNEERPIILSFQANKAVFRRCFYLRGDTSLVAVAVTVSPIMLNDRPIGAIEVFRDISAEMEVDKIKSEFISIASHELRTPATAVKTYLGMLLEGYVGELTPDQKKFIKTAFDCNERQLNILNDLLYVTKTESASVNLKKSAVDMVRTIKTIAKTFDDIMRNRHQDLVLTLPENAHIEVDLSLIRMVAENLISNASKYTPEGGRIVISVTDKSSTVEFSVADNGVGIDPHQIDKLFKKFSRLDNSLSSETSGSGIGLYLVKQIIELHNGKIKVKSTPNKGSKFTVTLPK